MLGPLAEETVLLDVVVIAVVVGKVIDAEDEVVEIVLLLVS